MRKELERALDGLRLRDFISVDGTERVSSRVRSSWIVDCKLYRTATGCFPHYKYHKYKRAMYKVYISEFIDIVTPLKPI